MESVFNLLRKRILSSAHETKYFEKEISRVINTIRDTAVNGVSNSLLIIGRRGSGKSHVRWNPYGVMISSMGLCSCSPFSFQLLREALKKAKLDPAVKGNLIEAHINGMLFLYGCICLCNSSMLAVNFPR